MTPQSPNVTMAAPAVAPDEIAAAVRVLESGQLAQGRIVAEFETAVAGYVGARHAYAVSSGTAALHLAYLSVIEPGDEVLVPTFTFFATASAVALAGGVPVFVDIDPVTFNIDLDDAARRVTDRTTAIAEVYLFGQPTDPGPMTAFAREHGLVVVGDAAQALGSRWNGRHVGTDGASLTAHSFYPTKNLFTGEGGMVTTDDAAFAEYGRLMRAHGMEPKYYHQMIGLNYRMTEMEAAIGLAQLPKLEARNERRRANAARYGEAFSSLEGISAPQTPAEAHHTYHQYTIVVDGALVGDRDEFAAALASRGIGSQVNYPLPLHHQQAFVDRFGSDSTTTPIADRLCAEVLSIPVHHHLTDADIARVIEAVGETATKMSGR